MRVAPCGLCCRGCWGAGVGWVAWYGLVTPPRPPPPVVLPGAAVAALRLAGAFAPGFALRARATACHWGARFALSPYGGARKKPVMGWSRRVSDNLQDSNPPPIGASSEGRLAWPQASSPSGHLRKAPRPTQPRVAPFSAPRNARESSHGLASPNVSQAFTSPLAYPRLNHFTRCAEVPCVNDSGVM